MNLEHFITQHPNNAYQAALKELRVQLITDALNLTNDHQANAAKLLGVERVTFRSWMRQLDML